MNLIILYLEYIGNVVVTIDIQIIRVLVVIGIAAIICAFLGIATLSKQKKNMWPFVLTLAGLIGTMIPSVIIFIAVLFLKSQYMGTLSCGIYPVVTPIAMIISMVTATQMHRRNQEYIKKMEAAEGLIFRGGDL